MRHSPEGETQVSWQQHQSFKRNTCSTKRSPVPVIPPFIQTITGNMSCKRPCDSDFMYWHSCTKYKRQGLGLFFVAFQRQSSWRCWKQACVYLGNGCCQNGKQTLLCAALHEPSVNVPAESGPVDIHRWLRLEWKWLNLPPCDQQMFAFNDITAPPCVTLAAGWH